MTGIKALIGMTMMSGGMVVAQTMPKASVFKEYIDAGISVILLAGIIALAGFIVWRQRYQDKVLSGLISDSAKASEQMNENSCELRKAVDRLAIASVNLESATTSAKQAADTMHDAVIQCSGKRMP